MLGSSGTSAVLLTLIHPSAWKKDEFSEVRAAFRRVRSCVHGGKAEPLGKRGGKEHQACLVGRGTHTSLYTNVEWWGHVGARYLSLRLCPEGRGFEPRRSPLGLQGEQEQGERICRACGAQDRGCAAWGSVARAQEPRSGVSFRVACARYRTVGICSCKHIAPR